jgi:hypothetical protein
MRKVWLTMVNALPKGFFSVSTSPALSRSNWRAGVSGRCKVWRGRPLKPLLEHVELAHYNRELVNWKVDEQVYRQFVLSPGISADADGAMNWRRPLWENFYPRIRRESDPEAAAEVVARFLRERVSVVPGEGLPSTVAAVWERQVTNERGFEAAYVAALRSVGVPARLGKGRAEYRSGAAWHPAPRPLVEVWR